MRSYSPRSTRGLPPAHYFALMRALCICLHPLHITHFQTFLPPTLLPFLLSSTITHPSLPDFIPPQQVAAAHSIFTLWPRHFFIFLDAIELWSLQAKKRHAFSSFLNTSCLGRRLTMPTLSSPNLTANTAQPITSPLFNAASTITSPPSKPHHPLSHHKI